MMGVPLAAMRGWLFGLVAFASPGGKMLSADPVSTRKYLRELESKTWRRTLLTPADKLFIVARLDSFPAPKRCGGFLAPKCCALLSPADKLFIVDRLGSFPAPKRCGSFLAPKCCGSLPTSRRREICRAGDRILPGLQTSSGTCTYPGAVAMFGLTWCQLFGSCFVPEAGCRPLTPDVPRQDAVQKVCGTHRLHLLARHL